MSPLAKRRSRHNQDKLFCKECGTELREPSHDGLCGFCQPLPTTSSLVENATPKRMP